VNPRSLDGPFHQGYSIFVSEVRPHMSVVVVLFSIVNVSLTYRYWLNVSGNGRNNVTTVFIKHKCVTLIVIS